MSMNNLFTGEVILMIDGDEKCLRLTLGALASLEAQLGVSGIQELIERLGEGAFSAQDLIAILDAGLKGGGHPTGIAQMQVEGGSVAAARAAMALILSAFPQGEPANAI